MSDYSKLKKLAEAAIQAGIESQERWPTADDWFEPDLISAEMDYVKSASPAAVLELIAKNKRLSELLECSQGDMRQADKIMQRDMKDAERYRWLREEDDYQICLHVGEELDAIIDSNIRKGPSDV